MINRCQAFLDEVVHSVREAAQGGDEEAKAAPAVLCVSHGGFIYALLVMVLGLGKSVVDLPGNCSLTIVDVLDEDEQDKVGRAQRRLSFVARVVNDLSHITDVGVHIDKNAVENFA
ncbi:unnamed protein product [Choristocarpus tenellus]